MCSVRSAAGRFARHCPGDLRARGAPGGFRVSGAPHMLRHAAGFALAEAGTETRLIQDFVGHKDIKNTVIYTETSQSRLRAVRVR